eukprot:403345216
MDRVFLRKQEKQEEVSLEEVRPGECQFCNHEYANHLFADQADVDPEYLYVQHLLHECEDANLIMESKDLRFSNQKALIAGQINKVLQNSKDLQLKQLKLSKQVELKSLDRNLAKQRQSNVRFTALIMLAVLFIVLLVRNSKQVKQFICDSTTGLKMCKHDQNAISHDTDKFKFWHPYRINHEKYEDLQNVNDKDISKAVDKLKHREQFSRYNNIYGSSLQHQQRGDRRVQNYQQYNKPQDSLAQIKDDLLSLYKDLTLEKRGIVQDIKVFEDKKYDDRQFKELINTDIIRDIHHMKQILQDKKKEQFQSNNLQPSVFVYQDQLEYLDQLERRLTRISELI